MGDLITAAQLCAIMPNLSRDKAAIFSPLLSKACVEFRLKQPEVLAMFLAQVAHESNQLAGLVENLNYSAEGLRKTWPTRFNTPELAERYARKPQDIANYVYGKRMGNTGPNDGWLYRGAGLIQLTGKDNYAAMEHWLGLPLVQKPEQLQTAAVAARSAAAFFANMATYHGRTAVQWALLCDLASCTRAINGGLIGLGERAKYYRRARLAFDLGPTGDA
jgi:putative chitinase